MNKNKFENLQSLILSQKPEKSQVIVWLQGDRFDRGKKVLDLFKKKFAQRILVSGNNQLTGKGTRPGENDVSVKKLKTWLIKNDISEKMIIVDDQSMNTSQQAKNVLNLCMEKKWKKILIVTSPYHQVRAFLTFLKYRDILGSKVRIINQSADLSWNKIASGRKLTQKQLVKNECYKIKKYKQNLASIQSGLNYFKSFTK